MNDRRKKQEQLVAELHYLRKQNATLLAQVRQGQQTAHRLNQHIEAMDALYDTTLALNNHLDLSTLLHSLVQHAIRLLNTEGGGIFLLSPDRRVLKLVVDQGRRDHQIDVEVALGEGVAGRVAQRGEAIQIENYRQWPGRLAMEAAAHIGRALSVPVKRAETIIGVLDVYDSQPGHFSADEVHLLSMLAAQAAVAIDNARLLEETQTALERTELLKEAVTVISSTLDLSEALEHLCRYMGQTLDMTSVYICSYERAQQQTTVLAEYFAPEASPTERVSDLGISYDLTDAYSADFDLLERGQAVTIHADDPRLPPYSQNHLAQFDAETVLILPLKVHSHFIAFVELWESRHRREFTPDEIELGQALAQHAGIALKNAQLFNDVEQNSLELATLLDVSRAISSTLELDRLLALITRHIANVVGVRGCALSRWDQESQAIVTWVNSQEGNFPRADQDKFYLADYPATRRVLEKQEPLVILANNPQADIAERRFMLRHNIGKLLILPLISGEQTIGLIELYDQRTDQGFSQTQIRLCQSLAAQAAVVIEKASLHQQTQQQMVQIQQILDTVPEGIFLLDHGFQLRQANVAARKYLGQIATADVGDTLVELGGRPINWLLQEAEAGVAEINITTFPRQIYEVQARTLDQAASAPGWVVLIRNVTKEREAQQRMQQQGRLAALGQFAAGIAHDFNNILTSIIGYTQLAIQAPGLDETTHADLHRVIKQGQRGARLVRQLLDFSRQSVREKEQLIELDAFLNDMTNLLEQTVLPNIQVVLNITYEESPFIISGDAVLLQQSLTNLARNAAEAMPGGGTLTLSLSHLRRAETGEASTVPSGQWVILTVSDTGCGIPPEHQEHIFEPFFTTKEVGQGAGLGLAQVYGIIKQHDGYITLKSIVSQGTTVSIYLPSAS